MISLIRSYPDHITKTSSKRLPRLHKDLSLIWVSLKRKMVRSSFPPAFVSIFFISCHGLICCPFCYMCGCCLGCTHQAMAEDGLDSLSGWWLGHPSEKYESVGMMRFPKYGKIKSVPNHQPVIISPKQFELKPSPPLGRRTCHSPWQSLSGRR